MTFRTGRGRRAGQRFDADLGVVTEALMFLGQLDPEAIGPSLEFATHYEPVPIADFNALLDAAPISSENAAFVDLGAGMGRALLLAARRRFRQVTGLEISPALCAIARDNVTACDRTGWKTRDVRVVRQDALDWKPPKGDVVVFMYNPFRGAVMDAVVERLGQANHGETIVLYHTPLERALFERSGRFELIAEFPFGLVYRTRSGA